MTAMDQASASIEIFGESYSTAKAPGLPAKQSVIDVDEQQAPESPPTFFFTPGHLGTHPGSHRCEQRADDRVLRKAAVVQRADRIMKRGRARANASRWSFSLDDGLVLEGLPLTRSSSGALEALPLTRSGISDLLDEINLTVAAQ